MNVGDLIEYSDGADHLTIGGARPDSFRRRRGIVVRFDVYKNEVKSNITKTPIVEVLWENEISWIAQSRVKVINGSQ